MFNKVAMAAVVCAAAVVTACAVSPELRVNTLNFLIEVSDVATTLTLGGEADHRIRAASHRRLVRRSFC